MKASEISVRRNQIVELLQEKGTLRVADAVRLLDVSHETVRQDFNHLEQQGLLKKIHGGAKLADIGSTADIQFREMRHYPEKLAIVREIGRAHV